MSENTKLHRNCSITHSQTTLGMQGISLMQRIQLLKRRQNLFWLYLGYPRLSQNSYLHQYPVFTNALNSCQQYIIQITMTRTTTMLVLVSFLVSYMKFAQISSCISHDAVIRISYCNIHTLIHTHRMILQVCNIHKEHFMARRALRLCHFLPFKPKSDF